MIMGSNQITGSTRLIPILAYPADHVQAPNFYNPIFIKEKLDWIMFPLGIHPNDFSLTVNQLSKLTNLQGLNITIPHKNRAFTLCKRLGEEAKRTGVVNTMRLDPDGNWSGDSFDGIGFVNAAKAHQVLNLERPVLMYGAGGAGTAIAFALAQEGIREIRIVNREDEMTQNLIHKLLLAYPNMKCQSARGYIEEVGLVVNATSLGLHSTDELPFQPEELELDTAVFDIIAARDTELMKASQSLGLKVIGGRAMTDHQIALQISFWHQEL